MAAPERQPAFETLQIHGGQQADKDFLSRGVPIYQTYVFNFESCAHAAELFAMTKDGEIATRTGNPTTAVLERRMAALEGGVASVAVSSGQAAVFTTIASLVSHGDNIVASRHYYHGAYNQFNFLFPEFGVECRTVEETPEAIRAAIDERTKAVYIETIGHPSFNVPDIQAIADVAHAGGVPLVVDNTVGAAYFCQPIKHGADIVVASMSKWLGGHGTSTGGIIVDSGNFDWSKAERFVQFNKPCPGFHGTNFVETFGRQAFIWRIRGQLLRDVGSCLSPFNSQQFLIGLETLSLRCERHAHNAITLARWLENHPLVEWVSYPGLPGHAHYELAQKYLPRGAGSVLMFGIKGGADAGEQLVDNFEMISNNAGMGDAKTTAQHPWSTTHKPMLPHEKIDLGVAPEMVRVSVGIEHIDDILYDIEESMRRSSAVPT
ncbi:Cys/Met metabolism PLP-dependent enzyme-domain-containing protein [Hypoxylon rubiginosum]|uniref:Cys/Met metabolism PLP-dependent enzyme-domain-containing protein n=1 Tax=Hypoxylon rubiginosum TaxID=110542 RepID=A0ACB9YK81_9PEZI|nr:Cys/Met metabolism PLP-dependent enzyme-domain-containing protein [Hypoxylon rubiginosum]